MKFSMTGHEKGYLLIQVTYCNGLLIQVTYCTTAWAGLTLHVLW